MQYAHETVHPRALGDSPLLHAPQLPRHVGLDRGVRWSPPLVGFLGDGPLDQPDNLWTNWVVQIAALILALRFTEWYPQTSAIARE